MDKKTNIFLAKKLFAELVFNTAYIEGVNVTFPQTQAIIDGAIVNNVPVSDIQTVLNLRDAWKSMLDTLDEPLTFEYICKVNSLVSRNESLEWGVLRSGTVGVGGTDYLPPIPVKADVEKRIEEINNIPDIYERAIEYFCYSVRGVLTIGKKEALSFNEALLHFYDTADSRLLKECLMGCIKGRDM